MKKVMSLPSSPAAMRKNSKTPRPSPKIVPAKLKRPKESKQSKKQSKKKLALSLKLTDDDGWNDFSDTTTSIGGSSDSAGEDEWESSFDPAWVVDEHELALHRQWTDQKGFTAALPAGAQKPSGGGVLRRSPLATNSALSSSFASPAAADSSSPSISFAGPDNSLLTSNKPAPGSGGNVLSYADLQSAAAPLSARSRHSPASSPREQSATSSSPPFTSAASLLPALDLDRVVMSSLGSSASRRNTIASPHEARESAKPFDRHTAVGQWKVGKISPREDECAAPETAKNESEGGQENEESEAARLSPRHTDLQIACERFEHLAQKELSTPGKYAAKRSGSKRRSKKKKVRSLNKTETAKEKRSEEERRRYRRSQGSPPMLLRGLGETHQQAQAKKRRGGSDSESGAAGYLAEEDAEYDSDSSYDGAALTSGSSGTKEEDGVASGSAPVSPQSSSGTAAINLSWRLRAEGLGSGGFPLSRSRSSEQVRARRMITKEDVNAAAGSPSPKRLAAEQPAVGVPRSPPNNNCPGVSPETSSTEEASADNVGDKLSPRGAAAPSLPGELEQETANNAGGGSTELTWKTIWEGGAPPHSAEATLGGVSGPSPSSGVEAKKKVLKRGLEGRSCSLPPSPLLQTLSPSLPAHISPLPFPPFATSPPASLTSSPSLTPPSSSPAMRHRRRAESSGTPQPLPFAPLMMPTVDSINFGNFRGHAHHHRGMERLMRTLSPGPSKRQAGHHLVVPLARAGRDAGGESGEIAAILLRTQSEDISSLTEFLEADDDDDDDMHFGSSKTGMRWPPGGRAAALSTRSGGSWRGRSDNEWRSRSRDAASSVSLPDCDQESLTTRRTRIERARSFGKEEDLLAIDDEEPRLGDGCEDVFSALEESMAEDDSMDDDHVIEAELTSFLKRTRSGSHRSLRGDFEGWRSPLSVRHGGEGRKAQLRASVVDDEEPALSDDDNDAAAFDEVDGGLESGESNGREPM